MWQPTNPDEPCNWGVDQVNYVPQHYLPGIDHPDYGTGVPQYSKDLAFELFTVPEPSMFTLIGLGLIGLLGCGRRRTH